MLRVDRITIAVDDMDEMRRFYSGCFNIEFKAFIIGETTLYTGDAGEFTLLLCPKSLAGIEADENTIQLCFEVSDISSLLHAAENHGGKIMNEAQEQQGILIGAIRDPDGNSIEIIQNRHPGAPSPQRTITDTPL